MPEPTGWRKSTFSGTGGVMRVGTDQYERGNWTPPDILDRIDDMLMSYDSQHADGDQPWPYGSF